MNMYPSNVLQKWKQVALLLIVTTVVTACGGSESTPIPEPSEKPTSMAETQLESPLAQSQSPLPQQISPLLSSETKLNNVEDAIALAAVTEAPQPDKGFGAFSGLVFSFGNSPGSIPRTVFYLAKAAEIEGEFTPPPVFAGPAKGDINGMTTRAGQVQVNNVAPGHYYFMVLTLYGWQIAFPSANTQQAPLLITIEEGDQLNLGVLYFDWP